MRLKGRLLMSIYQKDEDNTEHKLPAEPCNCDDCEEWRRRPYSGDNK